MALPLGATALAVPMSDTDALAAAATRASIVLYAVNPPYTQWDSDLLRLQRQGLEVARRLGALFMLPGNVYNFGAGTGAWLDQLVVKDPARGKLAYPGPLNLPHAWAYLPDLARAFVAVAVAAGECGLHPPRGWRHGGMPWGVIRVGGLVLPKWRELARMRYLWHVPHALDGSALAAAVGELPATPIVAALRQSFIDFGLVPAPTPALA